MAWVSASDWQVRLGDSLVIGDATLVEKKGPESNLRSFCSRYLAFASWVTWQESSPL